MSSGSILFISAEDAAAAGVEAVLRESPAERIEVVRVEALFDGLRSLQERSFNLVLSDLRLPDEHGMGALSHLRQHAPQTPVIVFCHSQDRETAVKAVRKGAYDFFCYEDIDPVNLRRSIDGAMKRADSPEGHGAERRNHARFPCRLAVSFQTLEHPIFSGQGTSETLNISSKGLLFTSGERFQAGQLVQVSLDWPARLENQVPLKLVAEGRIVRNADGLAAMTIEKYEFRTRRMASQPVASAAKRTATGVLEAPGRLAMQPRALGAQPRPAIGKIQRSPERRPF